MGMFGTMLARSGQLGLGYTERLLDGVTPATAARLARPGGQVIESNHPTFVLGHLALYPRRIMLRLEQPAGVTEIPEGWEPLFKAGAECRDDAEGTIYPTFDRLRETYFTAYQAALEALAQADDAVLMREVPETERRPAMFDTVGAAVGFLAGGHLFSHLGQISAWRRAMGLPPAI